MGNEEKKSLEPLSTEKLLEKIWRLEAESREKVRKEEEGVDIIDKEKDKISKLISNRIKNITDPNFIAAVQSYCSKRHIIPIAGLARVAPHISDDIREQYEHFLCTELAKLDIVSIISEQNPEKTRQLVLTYKILFNEGYGDFLAIRSNYFSSHTKFDVETVLREWQKLRTDFERSQPKYLDKLVSNIHEMCAPQARQYLKKLEENEPKEYENVLEYITYLYRCSSIFNEFSKKYEYQSFLSTEKLNCDDSVVFFQSFMQRIGKSPPGLVITQGHAAMSIHGHDLVFDPADDGIRMTHEMAGRIGYEYDPANPFVTSQYYRTENEHFIADFSPENHKWLGYKSVDSNPYPIQDYEEIGTILITEIATGWSEEYSAWIMEFAKEINPNFEFIYTIQANLEKKRSWPYDVNKVRELYNKALQLDPHNAENLRSLAELEKQEGNYEKAEKLLQKYIELLPVGYTSWINLGKIQFKLKKVPEMQTSFQEAFKRGAKAYDIADEIEKLTFQVSEQEIEDVMGKTRIGIDYEKTETRFMERYNIQQKNITQMEKDLADQIVNNPFDLELLRKFKILVIAASHVGIDTTTSGRTFEAFRKMVLFPQDLDIQSFFCDMANSNSGKSSFWLVKLAVQNFPLTEKLLHAYARNLKEIKKIEQAIDIMIRIIKEFPGDQYSTQSIFNEIFKLFEKYNNDEKSQEVLELYGEYMGKDSYGYVSRKKSELFNAGQYKSAIKKIEEYGEKEGRYSDDFSSLWKGYFDCCKYINRKGTKWWKEHFNQVMAQGIEESEPYYLIAVQQQLLQRKLQDCLELIKKYFDESGYPAKEDIIFLEELLKKKNHSEFYQSVNYLIDYIRKMRRGELNENLTVEE